MIDQAAKPDAAHFAQRAARQNGGVLDWDVPLVVEAIGHPAANLIGVEFPRIHAAMERVLVVVAVLADGPKPLQKCRSVPHASGGDLVSPHSVNSSPSQPTTTPAFPTIRRSGESSRSMGLVLLMWT